LRNILSGASIAVSEPFDLPTGSLTVMALVSANPRSSQADLAARAGITSPSLVGIIDDLEQRGLVKRERSSKDRRRNMLLLTAKGEKLMTDLFATVTEIEKPIRDALGPKDTARLAKLLDRAVDAITEAAT
jgi:DNA-binding MarR family transcriptional regulator